MYTECSVYIADTKKNGSQALSALVEEIDSIQCLKGDPPTEVVGSTLLPMEVGPCPVGRLACLLVAFCCSLYCCCGLWVQGSDLLSKRPRTKVPVWRDRLASEKP